MSSALLGLSMMMTLLAPPLGARGEGLQHLGAVNVITSHGPGSLDVVVPKGARIDLRRKLLRPQGPNTGFSVEGAVGVFVGIVLQPLEPTSAFDQVILGRFDPCSARKCELPRFNYVSPAEGDTQFDTGNAFPRYIELPAGRYRLFLIGDGPTRILLNLHGLQGSGRLVATADANVDAQSLPARLGTQGGDYMFASGATFDSAESGLFIANLFVQGREIENFHWGICAYNGPDAPPQEIAYGPHCTVLVRDGRMGAGASGRFMQLDRYSHKGFFVAQLSSTYAPDHFPPNLSGQRGLGAWYLTSSENVTAAGAQGVYLSFD